MIAQHFQLIGGLMGQEYASQAEQRRDALSKKMSELLSQKQIPESGWDEESIRMFIEEMSTFDSNNFQGNVGVGEREGRVACELVTRRHFGLAHGIGRSGDVMAQQPKAAGSSAIVQLTRYLALDALHIAGIPSATACCVLPAAIGMSLIIVFLALRKSRPDATHIVWSRVDKKAGFKAIAAAGFIPYVVELRRKDGADALETDVDGIAAACKELGEAKVLCICTTTSTSAPRKPDDVDVVAKLAKDLQVPHVINNAHGLQCEKCGALVERACTNGRVDAFVQSTDKSFMVPAGGAIVAGPGDALVTKVAAMYPGRASMSQLLDFFMTALFLGRNGWLQLRKERADNVAWLRAELDELAKKHGLRVLSCPANDLSLAVGIDTDANLQSHPLLSPEIFRSIAPGPRLALCVPPRSSSEVAVLLPEGLKVRGRTAQTIAGREFKAFGAHTDSYPTSFITIGCPLGTAREDLRNLLGALETALEQPQGAA